MKKAIITPPDGYKIIIEPDKNKPTIELITKAKQIRSIQKIKGAQIKLSWADI